jgi:hypothetical protein
LCHFHFRAGNASSGAKGPIKLCIHWGIFPKTHTM